MTYIVSGGWGVKLYSPSLCLCVYVLSLTSGWLQFVSRPSSICIIRRKQPVHSAVEWCGAIRECLEHTTA